MTAVYILNRSPTKSLDGKTPFEAWFGRKPGVRHFRTFGCVAYAKKVGPSLTKLADRSVPGVFLGYDPVRDKLMITRDVIFDEQKPWNWGEKGSSISEAAAAPYTFDVQYPDDTVPFPTTGSGSVSSGADDSLGVPASPAASIQSAEGGGSTITPPHTPISGLSPRSTPPAVNPIQWATPPSDATADSDGRPLRYRTIPNLLDTTDEILDMEYSGVCLTAAEEPRSVEEAMKEACWRSAMQTEMQSIEENRT